MGRSLQVKNVARQSRQNLAELPACGSAGNAAPFFLRHGLKNTKLALAAGERPSFHCPGQHYLEAIARGEQDRDWSAVSDSARWNAGLR